MSLPKSLIPDGCKFGIYALKNINTKFRDSRVVLDNEICVLQSIPFELLSHWKEWLGSIEIKSLQKSNLVILARRFSSCPSVLDEENVILEKRVRQYFSMLCLQRTPDYQGGRVLSGANVHGEIDVRNTFKPYSIFKHHAGESGPFVQADFLEAHSLFESFISIPDNECTLRFKKGLGCYFRGLMELSIEERLHQFVRSMEAILKTPRHQGTIKFVERGQLFLSNSVENEKRLRELYLIRNAVEHHHDLLKPLNDYPENERVSIFERRAFEVEFISRHVYKTILSSRVLRKIFVNEAEIDEFWNQPREVRDKMWTHPLDINSVLVDKYHSVK